MFKKIRHVKKREFLASFAETGNISLSAELVGIDRSTHYVWMKADPKYPELFAQAELLAGDKLEEEARRRAVTGVSEPVFYQGEVCGHIQKYSDTLLIVLLKGTKGEKYKDRGYVEQAGPGGGPINVAVSRTAGMTPEERKAALEEIRRQREPMTGEEEVPT